MKGPIKASVCRSHGARPAVCRERERQTATGGVKMSSTEIKKISSSMTVFVMSMPS